jgi:hypothetical protein
MGRMGDGYWLDPKSNLHWKVTTHDAWILDINNAEMVGISKAEHERLTTLNPVRDVDEIRMAGIHAGLVRIRSYHNRISVQFASVRSEEPEILRLVCTFLLDVEPFSDTPVDIDNLQTNDSARVTLRELQSKLNAGLDVMNEDKS